jgi:hypothetical protein
MDGGFDKPIFIDKLLMLLLKIGPDYPMFEDDEPMLICILVTP